MPRKRFQLGTVREVRQPSGNIWQGEWYVYLWQGGKEVRRRRTKVLGLQSRLTKQQAKSALVDEIARTTGQCDGSGSMTLEAAKVRYVASKAGAWSVSQLETFEFVWKIHVAPAWGKKRLDDLDRQRLQEWLNSLAPNFSHSLVSKARTNLSAVVDLALADELCRRNPAKRLIMPKTRKVKRGHISLEQARVLIKAAETERDRLILRILVQGGLRPQELSALRGNDFDRAGNRLRIDEAIERNRNVKETKTAASDGWIALPRSLADELAGYIERAQITPDAWLFHGRWPRMPFGQNDWRRTVLQPLAKAAGLGHIDYRFLRRTTATSMHQHGDLKSAQAQLRHASPDITAEVYIGEIPEEVRQAVEAIDHELGFDSERVIERVRI